MPQDQKYGILITPDIKLHRQWFEEMLMLRGINIKVKTPSSNKQYTDNGELVSNYNIVLCGHYHNGCVPAFLNKVMPKNSGIITPTKKVLPKNVRGIRKISNNTFLIYNGGWTKIPNNTPKPIHVLDKICNRQIDITILTKNISKEIEIKTKKIKMR